MSEKLIGKNVSNGVLGGVITIDTNNERVGINNPNPSVALDVSGDLNISGIGNINGNIIGSGFVGINEIDPDAYLHINWTKDTNGLKEMIKLSWDDAGAQDQQANDGTKIAFYTSSVNNAPGSVEAAFVGASRRSGSEGNLQTELKFATHNGSALTERLRLSQDGELHFFGQNISSAAAIHIRKESTATTNNEFIEFYRSSTTFGNGTIEGNIKTDGSGNLVFTNASTKKLKKNIKVNKGKSLNVMKQLRSVEFDWIDEDKPNECLGFIAEEVQAIYPNATGMVGYHEDKDGNVINEGVLGISMVSLIPVMWSVIKQLEERIEELENRFIKK
jgi:hypothetical protein